MKKEKNTESAQYGAAEIKQVYQRNFRRGLEFAVILHIVVLTGYFSIFYINQVDAADIKNKPHIIDVYNISDIEPPSVNENENNITKVEDIVKPIKELSALTPDPVAREKAEEMTIKTQDQLDKINVQVSHDGDSVKYVADNGNNNIVNNDHIDKNDIKITHNDNPDKNYNSYEVEVAPECVNLSAVKSSIDYPKTAIEAGIEGRVSIKVLVSSDGHVIQTGSITGPDIFYDEVRDKAKNLEFTPGLQNGKSVKVWVTVPFNFRLKNN